MSGRTRWRRTGGALLLASVAACAPLPKPVPPVPAPPPVAAPAPPAPMRSWEDRDLDAGEWRYDAAARTARFEQGGLVQPLLMLECTAGAHELLLTTMIGDPAGSSAARLRTSYGDDPVTLSGQRLRMNAHDARLDRIAFSRGRFAIDAADGSTLTLPVRSEIGRVIEDCRG